MDPLRHTTGSPILSPRWRDTTPNPPATSERTIHPGGSRESLTLVAYDISSPKRLRRIAKHCEDYGIRIQYSVFECQLTPADFSAFWKGLLALINLDEDRVIAYPVCASCKKGIKTAGRLDQAPAQEKPLCFIF